MTLPILTLIFIAILVTAVTEAIDKMNTYELFGKRDRNKIIVWVFVTVVATLSLIELLCIQGAI